MRIDPDAVYLELASGVHMLNRETGAMRYVPGVHLHFKDGGKWQKRIFTAPGTGDTLGEILSNIGKWIDAKDGIESAVDEVMGRTASFHEGRP